MSGVLASADLPPGPMLPSLCPPGLETVHPYAPLACTVLNVAWKPVVKYCSCLLYTSDAADERSSVDLGGRRIIKKKTHKTTKKQQKKKNNNSTMVKYTSGGLEKSMRDGLGTL